MQIVQIGHHQFLAANRDPHPYRRRVRRRCPGKLDHLTLHPQQPRYALCHQPDQGPGAFGLQGITNGDTLPNTTTGDRTSEQTLEIDHRDITLVPADLALQPGQRMIQRVRFTIADDLGDRRIRQQQTPLTQRDEHAADLVVALTHNAESANTV